MALLIFASITLFFFSFMCACACVHLIEAPLLFFCSRLASISDRLYDTLTPHCQTDGPQTIVDEVEEEEEAEELFFSRINHTQL